MTLPSTPRSCKWSLSFSVRHHKQLSKINQNVARVFNYNLACGFVLLWNSHQAKGGERVLWLMETITQQRAFEVCYYNWKHRVCACRYFPQIDTLHIEMASTSQICGGCNALTCCCPPGNKGGFGRGELPGFLIRRQVQGGWEWVSSCSRDDSTAVWWHRTALHCAVCR